MIEKECDQPEMHPFRSHTHTHAHAHTHTHTHTRTHTNTRAHTRIYTHTRTHTHTHKHTHTRTHTYIVHKRHVPGVATNNKTNAVYGKPLKPASPAAVATC